jgi:hypothetical protein
MFITLVWALLKGERPLEDILKDDLVSVRFHNGFALEPLPLRLEWDLTGIKGGAAAPETAARVKIDGSATTTAAPVRAVVRGDTTATQWLDTVLSKLHARGRKRLAQLSGTQISAAPTTTAATAAMGGSGVDNCSWKVAAAAGHITLYHTASEPRLLWEALRRVQVVADACGASGL